MPNLSHSEVVFFATFLQFDEKKLRGLLKSISRKMSSVVKKGPKMA